MVEAAGGSGAVGTDYLKSRIALYISCRKLKDLDNMSKSDPQVEVYTRERGSTQWGLIGKTEIVRNNLNPDFSTFVESDYYFEKEQQLRFMVYDVDDRSKDFIGMNETTIANVIGSVR